VEPTRGLIPLRNGVLNKKTKKLSPHTPGYRLTYCLPFSYDPTATCEPIVNWLRETVGHKEELVTFLLIYLNAIVNARADVQRYLELIGPGGTGKSTYMKLASYLIGERNVHTTKHQILEESRFETANLAGKLLTLITEADQYVGAVNVLKAITGQDSLHYEQKMKQAGEGFIYEGMVITAGNEPSRSTDYTSGLARRKIPIWFRNFIPASQRCDLDTEFKQYLPGLLNLVLNYSDEEVTDWLRNAEKKCPALHEYHREMLCETNPIADWIDNQVLREPGNRYTPAFLYNAYRAYSMNMGQMPVSQKRFSGLILDLCQVQLGWNDVSKGRDRYGRYILGLALRPDGDFSPFPITESAEFVTDKPDTVTDSVTAETTTVYGCDGCDGFLDDSTRTETVITAAEEKTSCVNDLQTTLNPSRDTNPSHLNPLLSPQMVGCRGTNSVTSVRTRTTGRNMRIRF
jgi:putative DNA primase/helicase